MEEGTYLEKVVDAVVVLSILVTSKGILEVWEVNSFEDSAGVDWIVMLVSVDIVTVVVTSEVVGSGVILSKTLDSVVVKVETFGTVNIKVLAVKVEIDNDFNGSELDGNSGSGVQLNSKVVDVTEVELE